jgi:hypothetical protein
VVKCPRPTVYGRHFRDGCEATITTITTLTTMMTMTMTMTGAQHAG